MRQPLILAALFLATAPAMAMTITARVAGGNISVHAGPHEFAPVVLRIADGIEITIDECTQVDSDSRYASFVIPWCHIPETGWVRRDGIVGRGLVNVTPPDFSGPGW